MSDIDRESVEWALSTTRELIAAGRPAPTPRTNEEAFDTLGEGQYGDKVVWADFARQLERELSTARADVERMREALETLRLRYDIEEFIEILSATRQESSNG